LNGVLAVLVIALVSLVLVLVPEGLIIDDKSDWLHVSLMVTARAFCSGKPVLDGLLVL